jgi:ABC-type glycerol-3-phosphate transport system substrate-binding protein
MTKRRFFAATGGAAVLGLLTACRPSSRPVGEAGTAPAADLRGITIEYWIQNALDHPEGMAKEKVMRVFTTANLHGIIVSATGGATIQKVVAATAGGAPPDLVDGFHFNVCALRRGRHGGDRCRAQR